MKQITLLAEVKRRIIYYLYGMFITYILLCLMPDDFTRQRETLWALKG